MKMLAFVQARHYSRGGNTPVTRVVIHDEESPEVSGSAAATQAYFAGTDRPASAHYAVDFEAVAPCVRESDVAYHAPPNAHSIGVEHAGYARQSGSEWTDAYSEAMLHVSAQLVADICVRNKLPVVWLTPFDLVANKSGITSHANVSAAWHQTTHTDPGPNFPVAHYLNLVRAFTAGPPEEDMFSDDDRKMLYSIAERLDPPAAGKSNIRGRLDEVVTRLDDPGADGIKGLLRRIVAAVKG